jgi:hypothetical protein
MATYTSAEGTSGTDEETSTNRTTNGNHVHVAGLHGLVEFDRATSARTALERFQVQAIARHEVLLLTPFGRVFAHGRSRGVNGGLLIVWDSLLVIHGGRYGQPRQAVRVKEGGGRRVGRIAQSQHPGGHNGL